MALPILPRREAIVDKDGFPSLVFKVWWQAVTRAFDTQDAAVTAAARTTVRAVTADDAANLSDDLLVVDATAGAVTIALPAAAGAFGAAFAVKKVDASGNAVTIDANGAETIDGAATVSISTQWETVRVVSDGSGWFVL